LLLFGINYLVYYGLLFVADKLSYLEAAKMSCLYPGLKMSCLCPAA